MSEATKADAGLTRRQFLKLGAASAGGIAVLAMGPLPVDASSGGDASDVPAMLIDASRCIGCNNCQRGCIEANGLHPTKAQLSMLSDETYTYIDHEGTAAQPRSVKRACMHCVHPACVAACTVGALKRTAAGLVVADTDKCIGCRYCQYACPFGVPQFEWEKPLGTIRKCNSCVERLAAGEQPACTANCASGALRFGTRGDLIKQAHMRIDAHPDFYVNRVYGETEVGGTTRLYISDVPFDKLGLPTLGSEPAPKYAEAVMTQTPTIAVSVAALATGIYSLLRWRDKHAPHIAAKQEESK